jgi:hypothetical protein
MANETSGSDDAGKRKNTGSFSGVVARGRTGHCVAKLFPSTFEIARSWQFDRLSLQ